MNGITLIHDERVRQLTHEGYDESHDREHRGHELAVAGAAYALSVPAPKDGWANAGLVIWPWEPESFKPSDDPVRNLARAGALIAAEIDRLLEART